MAPIKKQKRSQLRAAAAGLIVLIAATLARPDHMSAQTGRPNVITQHNDNSRTGANLAETVLNTSTVNVNQFGKLFSRAVDGEIYAQPLYVSGVTIGQTVHNVVYVATMNNSLYAFDADAASASAPLWQDNFGPPVPVADVGELQDIDLVVGITSTPVIDTASSTLYCVAKTKEGGSYVQRLHAVDISSGQERSGSPVIIDGSVPGTGDGSVALKVPFNPLRELNRPALLLSNGYVYIAFGSHGDQRPYHGWVFAYDATTLQQAGVFNDTPDGWGGGIWSSGQGLVEDGSGFVYFMTGNGTFNMNAGGQSCSSCFVKVTAPFTGLVDWFAPYNQNDLNVNNFDLNSSGPLLLPRTNFIIGGGKEGKLYVLDRANMGHFQAGSNSQIVQELQITYGDHLHGSPIYWESPVHGPLVYVWYEETYLEAFKIVNGVFENNTDPNTGLLSPATQSTMRVPPGMPGGVLSLSANGSAAGSGIVWATTPYSGNAQPQTVAGIFRAFDASDLSVELWNSKQNAARDDSGDFAKFTPPTVANGKVYVATFSNQLLVYGLLGASAPAPSVTGVAPASGPSNGGTALTITGTNFAPGATVTLGGNAATNVSVVSSTTITATTPPQAAGTVSVTVTNTDGQSGTLTNGFTYTAASAAISFVQVAEATPQTPTATVAVTYSSPQTPGNLNIVAVGWNDTVATVQSVQDNAGNTYQMAIGPTSGTRLRQSIYYASGIQGGATTVTVTFNLPALYPDIRILEYAGVTTLDATAGASGTGTTSDSGPATTTVDNELIFGANTVSTNTAAAGPGFTVRTITQIDSDIAEDMIGATAGSYGASATLGTSGNWVMQMATFKAAPAGPPPTTPPSSAAMIADVFVDMNVADPAGSTLSVPIMTNGTQGSYSRPWEETPEPPIGFTLGPHLHDRGAPVQVGSTVYATNHPSKSMALDHAYNYRTEHITIPTGHHAVSIAGFVTFGPQNAGSASELFDYWEIQARVSGDFAILQLDNGRGGHGYAVAIETNPNGVTTHSPYISIAPGATYWCVLNSDFTSGVARLALYDSASWSVVGSVTSVQSAGNQNVGWINIGNNESGQAPGMTSYFENILIDYTSARFPLGPGAP
jgi:hypothetical protein